MPFKLSPSYGKLARCSSLSSMCVLFQLWMVAPYLGIVSLAIPCYQILSLSVCDEVCWSLCPPPSLPSFFPNNVPCLHQQKLFTEFFLSGGIPNQPLWVSYYDVQIFDADIKSKRNWWLPTSTVDFSSINHCWTAATDNTYIVSSPDFIWCILQDWFCGVQCLCSNCAFNFCVWCPIGVCY